MTDHFYAAFEDRYRGSRELIYERLRAYLPFLEPLASLHPGSPLIDLGCGRGEWLQLTLDQGFNSFGVDLDAGMLASCKALGLPVQQGDALAYLAGLPDNSQAIVSAFHLVEHIPFDALQVLVTQSLRVLKPGGLLIMETPNPENIVVGTSNFYLDPTHQRPIPSLLLSFLTEHQGFARTKVLRLQESPTLLQQQVLSLHDVFAGVSPDYAVVAQKDALSAVLKPFDSSFSREYGLSLQAISKYYDIGIQGPIHRLDKRQRASEVERKAFETRIANDLDRISSAHQELDAQLQKFVHHNLHQVALDVQNLHHAHHALSAQLAHQVASQEESVQIRLQQAEYRVQRAEQASIAAQTALNSVYASTSWRLLSPLRWSVIQLKLLVAHGPLNRARALRDKLSRFKSPLPPSPPLAAEPLTEPPVLHVEQAIKALPPQPETVPAVAVPLESPLSALASADAVALSVRTRAIHERLQKAFSTHSGMR